VEGPDRVTRDRVEALLYREARLLDDLALEDWLTLFADDGLYWIPIDETKDPDRHASLVYDNPLRREERVYHLLNVWFPAQSPPSRTVHFVSNIEVVSESGELDVRSHQIVYEVRSGDFRQTGLGEVRPIVARVRHRLIDTGNALLIRKKTILLIDRDMPQSNLTFLL
jgi:3-phenylpropionate/cinnamic acid dioxygenase small subunit